MGQKNTSFRFHPQVLGVAQERVLRQLGSFITGQHFYLGGGTAVALYLGHRRSVDLDWFTERQIHDPLRLAQEIRENGIPFVAGQVDRGTLYGTVAGVRVSFLEYRYPLLKKTARWSKFNCSLASREDLACMKLSALAQRGSKKDFVDVFALGKKCFSLWEMLRLYPHASLRIEVRYNEF